MCADAYILQSRKIKRVLPNENIETICRVVSLFRVYRGISLTYLITIFLAASNIRGRLLHRRCRLRCRRRRRRYL